MSCQHYASSPVGIPTRLQSFELGMWGTPGTRSYQATQTPSSAQPAFSSSFPSPKPLRKSKTVEFSSRVGGGELQYEKQQQQQLRVEKYLSTSGQRFTRVHGNDHSKDLLPTALETATTSCDLDATSDSPSHEHQQYQQLAPNHSFSDGNSQSDAGGERLGVHKELQTSAGGRESRQRESSSSHSSGAGFSRIMSGFASRRRSSSRHQSTTTTTQDAPPLIPSPVESERLGRRKTIKKFF